jgi:hypothetical protein
MNSRQIIKQRRFLKVAAHTGSEAKMLMAISLGVALSRAKRAYQKNYLNQVVAAVVQTYLPKIRFRPNLKNWYLV